MNGIKVVVRLFLGGGWVGAQVGVRRKRVLKIIISSLES